MTLRNIGRSVGTLFLLIGSSAQAATITVNTNLDQVSTDANCSLREALSNANNDNSGVTECTTGSGTDTIVFSGVSSTIILTASLTISASTIIDGGSGVVIDGNDTYRIFYIDAGFSLNVELRSLTLQNGFSGGNGGAIYLEGAALTLTNMTIGVPSGGNRADYGGGIYAQDCRLILDNTTLQDNSATIDGGAIWAAVSTLIAKNGSRFILNVAGTSGGGVYDDDFAGLHTYQDTLFDQNSAGTGGAIHGAASPRIVIQRSTFIDNEGFSAAGAIYQGPIGSTEFPGGLEIEDSTFAMNFAPGSGGALYIPASAATTTIRRSTFFSNTGGYGGAISATSNLNIVNSTFSANISNRDWGGAILMNTATAKIAFCTFDDQNQGDPGDTDSLTSSDIFSDGAVVTLFNSIGTADGNNSSYVGNYRSSAAGVLGTLGDNGGPTQTMPILDAAFWVQDVTTCRAEGFLDVVATDQRGMPRGDICDIGAFELNSDFSETTVLISTTEDPIDCDPEGGWAVNFGADNGDGGGSALNGMLEAGEIDNTINLCNGTPGATGAMGATGATGLDGSASLAMVTTLSTGDTNCATGGLQIDIGLDDGDGSGTPGDGILQSGEIDATQYVCHGSPGADGIGTAEDGRSLLIQGESISSGEECPSGGTRVQSGLDNGDGGGTADNDLLETGEVDTTFVVCNGEAGAGCRVGSDPPGGRNLGIILLVAFGLWARRLRSWRN